MARTLAGVAEIARATGEATNTVGNWVSRRPKGFPKPVAELAMGQVFDLDRVLAWYEDRRAS
jgi:phosphoglycerate dehydrogenase-like enzyme